MQFCHRYNNKKLNRLTFILDFLGDCSSSKFRQVANLTDERNIVEEER